MKTVPLKEKLEDLEYKGAPKGPYEELCARLEMTPKWPRFRAE